MDGLLQDFNSNQEQSTACQFMKRVIKFCNVPFNLIRKIKGHVTHR